jgi:hypothetical protein
VRGREDELLAFGATQLVLAEDRVTFRVTGHEDAPDAVRGEDSVESTSSVAWYGPSGFGVSPAMMSARVTRDSRTRSSVNRSSSFHPARRRTGM